LGHIGLTELSECKILFLSSSGRPRGAVDEVINFAVKKSWSSSEKSLLI
jgi:hypothetical protein